MDGPSAEALGSGDVRIEVVPERAAGSDEGGANDARQGLAQLAVRMDAQQLVGPAEQDEVARPPEDASAGSLAGSDPDAGSDCSSGAGADGGSGAEPGLQSYRAVGCQALPARLRAPRRR